MKKKWQATRKSWRQFSHRGHYKKIDNHVEALDESGKSLGVVFATALPFDTPGLMAELEEWTNKSLQKRSFHPLLIIAVFVVVFLQIHPFQDGNGRLSRIGTSDLLRGSYDTGTYRQNQCL